MKQNHGKKEKKINWSALARKYEVHKPSDPTSLAGNGGQIIQAVLEDAGFDTSRFVGGKGQQTGAPRCRRSKLRSKSGIAFPSQTPFSKLQEKKNEMYDNHILNKPIDIVPRDFEQTRLQDDGTVKTVTKTIYGQKVPLPQLVTAIMTDMHNRGFLTAANINATTLAEEEVDARLRELKVSCQGTPAEKQAQLLI